MAFISMVEIKDAVVSAARAIDGSIIDYTNVSIAWVLTDNGNALIGFVVNGGNKPIVDSVALYAKGKVYLLDDWQSGNPTLIADCPEWKNWIDKDGNHVELPSLA